MIEIIIPVIAVLILLRLLYPELFKPEPPTGVISGILTQVSGSAVAGATVTLYTPDLLTEIAIVTSGADGAYELPAEAMGEYHITAIFKNTDGTWLQADREITLDSTAMVVDLIMESTTITGFF